MEYEELESLWNENSVKALLRFYREINSPKKAVEFSLRRKKPEVHIRYKKIGTNACFVVPTADIDKFMTTDYWNYISRFDTIIVESNGKNFNYAYSMNSGIKEALSYGYSKIILSNDDMIPVDRVDTLNSVLAKMSDSEVVLPNKVISHKTHNFAFLETFSVVKRNLLYNFLNGINWRKLHKELAKYLTTVTKNFLEFNYAVFEGLNRKTFNSFFLTMLDVKMRELPLFNSFGIFDAEILNKNLFDTVFINGKEDYDLIIRILSNGYSVLGGAFKIADVGGQSLNKFHNGMRSIKDLLGDLILNYKLRDYFSHY